MPVVKIRNNLALEEKFLIFLVPTKYERKVDCGF